MCGRVGLAVDEGTRDFEPAGKGSDLALYIIVRNFEREFERSHWHWTLATSSFFAKTAGGCAVQFLFGTEYTLIVQRQGGFWDGPLPLNPTCSRPSCLRDHPSPAARISQRHSVNSYNSFFSIAVIWYCIGLFVRQSLLTQVRAGGLVGQELGSISWKTSQHWLVSTLDPRLTRSQSCISSTLPTSIVSSFSCSTFFRFPVIHHRQQTRWPAPCQTSPT